jgi:hypothetical protein
MAITQRIAAWKAMEKVVEADGKRVARALTDLTGGSNY